MPLSRVRNSGCLDGHLHLSTARQVTGTLPTDITQPFNSGSGRVGFGQRPGCTTATLKKLPQHHRDDECIFGVGSGGSGDEKAAVQGHKRLKGGLPSRCRPTLPALATTAVTEQQNWIYTPAPLRLTLPPPFRHGFTELISFTRARRAENRKLPVGPPRSPRSLASGGPAN